MGLARKLNVLRGWPNPHIYEVATAAASSGDLAKIDEGRVAYQDTNGKWIVVSLTSGYTAALKYRLPFLLWNGAAKDGDHGVDFDATKHFAQVQWGGIQGLGLNQALLFETASFTGTPALYEELSINSNGVWVTAGSGDLVIGVCEKASHKMSAGAPGGATSTSQLASITVRNIVQPYQKA